MTQPMRAMFVRALASLRTSTIWFAVLFALYAYANVRGYGTAFPHAADKARLASTLGSSAALRAFYGFPRDLHTVGGYVAWRVGGALSIAAAAQGLMVGVRLLRGEEESGRAELVMAGIVSRAGIAAAAMVAAATALALANAAFLVALVVGGLSVGNSAVLAMGTFVGGGVFAGVGALAGQVAPTRRTATGAAVGLLVVAVVVRIVADTRSHQLALQWLTPLGWTERLRAFSGASPVVLLVPVAACAVLAAVTLMVNGRRDIGTGLLRMHDDAPPRPALLGAAIQQIVRASGLVLVAWMLAVGAFAAVLGSLSGTVEGALGRKVLHQFAAFLGTNFSAKAYIGAMLPFFALALCAYACSQLGAARHEEATGRLDTLLALPLGRQRWLAARIAWAAFGVTCLAAAVGAGVWLGCRMGGTPLPARDLARVALDCLPIATLALGASTLLVAVVPRYGVGIAYGLSVGGFFWALIATALKAPKWAANMSPFQHLGIVPVNAIPAHAALVMAGLGAGAAAIGVLAFARRDLVGA
jgi:ABC-2 type transport system permease protein